jgi:hypothetical protein
VPVPEFLSVIAFGALDVPLGVLEKLTDDGDTVSFGEVWAIARCGVVRTAAPNKRIKIVKRFTP